MGAYTSDLSPPLVIGVPMSPVPICLRKGYHIYVPIFDLVEGSVLILVRLPGLDAVGVLEEHPNVTWPWFIINAVSPVHVPGACCGVVINLFLMRSLGGLSSFI